MRKQLASVLLVSGLFLRTPNAQVRSELAARQFKVKGEITAKVVNSTKHTIAYRVGHGPWGFRNGDAVEIEWISSPFEIWWKSAKGRWGILLTGIDIGSSQEIATLDPGQSEEYGFKLEQAGEVRLSLEYAFDNGANTDCSDPYGKVKKIRSPVFTVYQAPAAASSQRMRPEQPSRPRARMLDPEYQGRSETVTFQLEALPIAELPNGRAPCGRAR